MTQRRESRGADGLLDTIGGVTHGGFARYRSGTRHRPGVDLLDDGECIA